MIDGNFCDALERIQDKLAPSGFSEVMENLNAKAKDEPGYKPISTSLIMNWIEGNKPNAENYYALRLLFKTSQAFYKDDNGQPLITNDDLAKLVLKKPPLKTTAKSVQPSREVMANADMPTAKEWTEEFLKNGDRSVIHYLKGLTKCSDIGQSNKTIFNQMKQRLDGNFHASQQELRKDLVIPNNDFIAHYIKQCNIVAGAEAVSEKQITAIQAYADQCRREQQTSANISFRGQAWKKKPNSNSIG